MLSFEKYSCNKPSSPGDPWTALKAQSNLISGFSIIVNEFLSILNSFLLSFT